MLKIKEFVLKNKKLVIIIGTILLLSILGVGGYFVFRKKPTTLPLEIEEKKVENTYTMYVKINPLVKIVLKEVYTECTDEDGKKTVCSSIENSVVDYELINDDAKEVYDDLDFNGKTVLDVLVMLCDTARENDIGFEKLEITSDWSNYYTEDEIKEALKESGKYEYNIKVYVDFTEHPESSDILEEIKKYTVTFETNGGTKIEEQEVLENTKATKPADPTKDGYTFVEWQLNKKAYNFDNEVTKDITLKAKWKKVEEEKEPEKEENKKEDNKVEDNKSEGNNNTETKEPEKQEPVIKDTTESRIEKINLNENILFYHSGGGFGGGCGVAKYKIFATNLETLFPGYVKNNNIYLVSQDDVDRYKEEGWELEPGLLLESEWEAKYSQITFDSAKESSLLTTFNNLKNSKTTGIDNFEYEYSNHQLISYSYGTIYLEEYDKFITLSKSLENVANSMDSKINNATKGMYTVSNYFGGCGSMPEPELLTESECNRYNLTCDRW